MPDKAKRRPAQQWAGPMQDRIESGDFRLAGQRTSHPDSALVVIRGGGPIVTRLPETLAVCVSPSEAQKPK
jgi:hypothetical protein